MVKRRTIVIDRKGNYGVAERKNPFVRNPNEQRMSRDVFFLPRMHA